MITGESAGDTVRVYVGSYTTKERKARGDGIHAYSIDSHNGQWTHIHHLGDLTNPSFLCINRNGTRLYAAHGDLDYVSSIAVDPETGHMSSLGRAATGGKNGVSLTLDPSERHLIVANYIASNVSVHPIAQHGLASGPSQIMPLSGTPNTMRRVGHQEHAYPHDVAFDPSGHYLAVVDKGLDGVHLFRFECGTLHPHRFMAARGGAGPRHIIFDPKGNLAWVCNELESSVTSYRWDADSGSLTPIDIAWTLPPDFIEETTTAEVAYHSETQTLYVSNRGHDSVVMFRVAQDGTLKTLGWQPTGGESPRFFAIDPTRRFLYVANENSDSIVPFAIDASDGRLTQAGPPIANESPVTIVFSSGRGAP